MFILPLLICYISVALSAPSPDENLRILGIVGGERANQKYFNYQVSLEVLGKHHCGGSLISTNIVITAAHCTHNLRPEYFRIRVGSGVRETGGRVYNIKYLVEHSGFSMRGLKFDVAILKLVQHVRISKTVRTVPLASVEPKQNTPALVSGWGVTKEKGQLADQLRFGKVTVFDRKYCKSNLSPFTREMICAGKKEGGVDSCQADSGGPLVADGKLIGIVSWGDGCGRPGSPGVYTNVARLRPWIDFVIKKLSQMK